MQDTRRLLLLSLLAGLASAQTKTEAGITAFREGHYTIAAQNLKDATDDRGRAFYGLSQAALGNCKFALPDLEKTSNAESVLRRLTGIAAAKCWSSLGDDAAAFSLLQSLQKSYPNDPDVLYTGAKLHMKAFNDATLAMFQRTPASYRVHELSAEIFEIQNRFTEAVAEYRKAIELNPRGPDLHFRLGRAILLQSHEPKALDLATEQIQAELKISPEDSASEFQLGQIALVKSDTKEASIRFHRALALSPDFVAALISLGKLSSHEKDYLDAIGFLSHAVKLQRGSETAHYALMIAYRDNGQIKEAKAEKAILDRLQKPPEGEFSDFLKKLGEKPVTQ